MKNLATAVAPAAAEPKQEDVRPLYLEALTLVERLHRRLLRGSWPGEIRRRRARRT